MTTTTYSVVASGKVTVAASLPAVFASKETAVSGLVTATDEVIITKANKTIQAKTDSLNRAIPYQVVPAANKFTIYHDLPETPEIIYSYIVVRKTTA